MLDHLNEKNENKKINILKIVNKINSKIIIAISYEINCINNKDTSLESLII
jgi:hypothetical protein